MEAASEWSEAVAKVPHPRSPEVLAADPEVRRALAAGTSLVVVPVIRESGRPTRANISMDAGTLAAIDEEAAARGLTRSAFIAGAALEKRTAHQARSVRRPLLS
jgi:hypothetical protein